MMNNKNGKVSVRPARANQGIRKERTITCLEKRSTIWVRMSKVRSHICTAVSFWDDSMLSSFSLQRDWTILQEHVVEVNSGRGSH